MIGCMHDSYGHVFLVQVQSAGECVRDVVMVLVGHRAAPQRMWLHLLFHIIPVMETCRPPVFTHKDTHLLLARVQVRRPEPS